MELRVSCTQTRVYVVDDDSQLREDLQKLVERAGYAAATFDSGDTFLTDYPNLPPGCIVLDVAMKGMSGLDLQRKLVQGGCRWPFIILTGHADPQTAGRAVGLGVVAFLTKPVRNIELLAAILKGEAQLFGVADPVPQPEVVRRAARLTRREREVLRGLLEGLISKEMAAQLGISASTVNSYRLKLMRKLGANTPAELAMLAIRAGYAKL